MQIKDLKLIINYIINMIPSVAQFIPKNMHNTVKLFYIINKIAL